MKSWFLEPPRVTKIGSKNRIVREIGGYSVWLRRGNDFWLESSGGSKKWGFEKSGFYCSYKIRGKKWYYIIHSAVCAVHKGTRPLLYFMKYSVTSAESCAWKIFKRHKDVDFMMVWAKWIYILVIEINKRFPFVLSLALFKKYYLRLLKDINDVIYCYWYANQRTIGWWNKEFFCLAFWTFK